MQVRREARAACDRREVAIAIVPRDGGQEIPECHTGACLTGRPDVESGRPVGLCRQQLPVFQPLACRPVVRRGDFGHRQRPGRRHLVLERAPPWREDAIAAAGAGQHLPRRGEEVAVVELKIEFGFESPATRVRSDGSRGYGACRSRQRARPVLRPRGHAAGSSGSLSPRARQQAQSGCGAATSATPRPCGGRPASRHRE